MNDYLKDAREYIAYADTQEDSHAAQMALAAAAIAQAEATAEQTETIDNALLVIGKALVAQAEAMERSAVAMEKIADLLNGTITFSESEITKLLRVRAS